MEKKFTIWRDNARIDVRFSVQKGKIEEFAINVSYEKDGEVIEVYRADTEHGFLHEHIFGEKRKVRLEESFGDYNAAFEALYEYAKKHADEWVK
ncbi:hypothetical protein HZC09_04915 [Candidatus Micrarchaeota archaeon]|nr:hypothetical protein [Candidatus Micrarchaeota archaeon]